MTTRRQSTLWALETGLTALGRGVTRNNSFNVVVPEMNFEDAVIDQGDYVPRVRQLPPNREQLTQFSFDSNEYFQQLVALKGEEQGGAVPAGAVTETQATDIAFWQVYESDRHEEANYRSHKVLIETWRLNRITETTVRDTRTPIVYTYIFQVERWRKAMGEDDDSLFVYEEVDLDNHIIRRYPLITDASTGLITGVGDAINYLDAGKYPAVFS